MKKSFTKLSISSFLLVFFSLGLFAQSIQISEPQENTSYEIPASVNIEANVDDVIPGEPVHLKVINNQSGYRKLKIGNNPLSLYSPAINVIATGNDKLEITLRDVSGTAEWSKIRFRPKSKGSLNLSSYVENAGGDISNWTTIVIPLADFDPTIDFTAINFIEFPYSADADFFEIDISEIKFTGSTTPVEWFGSSKNNNIHNGNSGPGELFATIVPVTEAISNVEKVAFYTNTELLGEDTEYPFTFNFKVVTPGQIALTTKVTYLDGSIDISQPVNIFCIEPPVFDLGISISSPQENLIIEAPANVSINADIIGAEPPARPYIHVTNELSGYRKLQIGYNAVSIYGHGVNPIASGNDTLEITIADNLGTTNWSRIRIRPSAIGSLNISEYVAESGGVGLDGTTLKIPLSDFDPNIDFSNISYFQFPYSADAGNLNIEIYSMKFTGGTEDFIWFGENKTDNAQNGNGGPGELVAEIIVPESPENVISLVTFYNQDNLLFKDYFPPYTLNLTGLTEGNYEFTSVVTSSLGQTAGSNTINVQVDPPAILLSSLNIELVNPLSGDVIPAPAQFIIETEISGTVEPQPAYLLVSNTQTGYRKLKFGNNSNSIYGPAVDLMAGGNHTMEITLKNFGNNPNWSKIKLRPKSIGSLVLKPYIEASGSDLSDWTTISIPLSDFDSRIDFSNITFLEFPYSADAGYFEIGIQSVVFTGGTDPFLWFGNDKLDNAHNGNGGPGELVASVVEASQQSLDISFVEFFRDGIKVGETSTSPWSLDMFISDAGNYALSATVTDSENLQAFSDTVNIIVEELTPEQGIFITVQFDEIPENVSVSKATLKYNKDFAYSFSLDDGRIDAYSYTFQMFNGGYIEANNTWYPGLFYTDGCGNDIPFRGALAWNSVNSNYFDLHVNTPDYVTWTQLSEMYSAGWDVFNHSYSHAAYGETDYNFEITQNREYVFEQTGIDMSHFVVPSGDINYIQPAFDLGNKVVYTSSNSYLGYYDGLPVDDAIDNNELRIFRKMIYDDAFTIENVSRYLDDVAANSTNGNHYWWSEFTHRVRYEQTGASLVFPTFEYYMNYIQQTWGKDGSDKIWMAPAQEVYEYLLARDQSNISYVQNGNKLTILLQVEDLPVDLRNYDLSLVIDADMSFSTVEISGGEVVSYNGTAPQKLINLRWDGNTNLKSGVIDGNYQTSIDKSENPKPEQVNVYPNPVTGNNLFVSVESQVDDQVIIQLIDMFGNAVLVHDYQTIKGANTIQLPVEGIPSGIYILKICTQDCGILTKKVSIK